jgi:valyl-tRNA synthetase
LLAPVIPHVTEEIYQALYVEAKGCPSLQLTKWPEMKKWENEKGEQRGDTIITLISAVRREKAEKHLPLNTPIKKLKVCAETEDAAEAVKAGVDDILGACKVENLDIMVGKGIGKQVGGADGLTFTAEY